MAIYFLMRQNSKSLNFIGSSRTMTVGKKNLKKKAQKDSRRGEIVDKKS